MYRETPILEYCWNILDMSATRCYPVPISNHFYLQHLPRLAQAERVAVPGPSPRHKDVLAHQGTASNTGGDAIVGLWGCNQSIIGPDNPT